jgi:hypothetical protein
VKAVRSIALQFNGIDGGVTFETELEKCIGSHGCKLHYFTEILPTAWR